MKKKRFLRKKRLLRKKKLKTAAMLRKKRLKTAALLRKKKLLRKKRKKKKIISSMHKEFFAGGLARKCGAHKNRKKHNKKCDRDFLKEACDDENV